MSNPQTISAPPSSCAIAAPQGPFQRFGLAQYRVHVLLGRNHHPGSTPTDSPQFFGNRLKVEHQVGIGANELPDFIHQENQAMLRSFRIEVLFHPLTEVLDGQ